ncbi:hypothetical protein D554_2824 [Bordetella holmesii 30539]|nr:hypothetical protein D554_2824 [Bordetella holmesii 30539]
MTEFGIRSDRRYLSPVQDRSNGGIVFYTIQRHRPSRG